MQYNYSAHIVEQFEKVLANMGNRVEHNGIGMRFSRGVASTIKPLVESIKVSPKFALPDNGDVLGNNWGKVLEMCTGEFLRLPYPEVVLEYSFSDVSHLGPDRMLISKRLVICIEYDPYKDSPLGQTVRSMVGSNADLSGAVLVFPVFFNSGVWMPYPFAAAITRTRGGCSSGLVYVDNGRRIESSVGYTVFPIGREFAGEMIAEHGMRGAYDTAMSDTAEEIFVVLGLCVSLSCSNVGIVDTPAPEKLNKKRVKNGRMPFYGYKEIVIKPAANGSAGSKAGCAFEGRQSPRLHARRGHIRHLQGGEKRVWVSAAMVGSGTKGVVKSTYRVGG